MESWLGNNRIATGHSISVSGVEHHWQTNKVVSIVSVADIGGKEATTNH